MDKKVSLKISQLQFVLCTLIVIMHSMNTTYDGLFTSSLDTVFQYLLGGGICQIAVPTFYFISAYLFYWNCDSSEDLKRKILSRIHTLICPYLIWNTIWEFYYYLLWKIGYSEKKFIGYKFINFFLDILNSNNTALWFVKWLIVFSLLSPVIVRLIDNKKVFVVFEIIVTIMILIFKIPYYSILYWTPFYLLGAYIGHSYYELFYLIVCLDMKKQAVIILSSILMILSGIFFIMIKWQSYYAILYLRFIGTLCTLGLLFSLPIFKNDKHYKIFDYTFPIYCMHVPVVGILKHFLRGVIGFIFIPILVIGSLFYVSAVVKNRMPRLYSVLFGR